MNTTRVLVVGGYGFFGRRLVTRLSKQLNLHVTVAGRSLTQAQALVGELQPTAQCELAAAAVDALETDLQSRLRDLAPDVLVNASGPFQGRDYRVARACIAAGVHYIDLADGRAFVAGIGTLHAEAVAAKVFVTSGASSVPALSCAVVDHLTSEMQAVRSIDIGINPGNRTERGLSTVQGILSYCGKELPSASGEPLVGWLKSYRHHYPPPVGSRLHSPCDVPDLVLLPERYAGRPQVRFGAGLELEFLHWGMNLMAWLARHQLIENWAAHATLLKKAADLFKSWGSDAGGMYVTVSGTSAAGLCITRKWYLVATHGDGPYVPTLAASALIRKLATGVDIRYGAMPCIGLLTIGDFEREMLGLKISTSESAD